MLPKIIFGCWDIFILFWLLTMFSNKRTVKRESVGHRLLHVIPFFFAFWLLFPWGFRRQHSFASVILLPHSLDANIIGLVLTVLGLGLAIWARITLGRNWSATVTFKENHELIVTGPYAFVRHPIYSAILLMFLGNAFAVGTAAGFLGFLVLIVSFWIKYRQEEAFMLENFGNQYRDYMKRVSALIPFVF